jgi:hypothetical protein
MQIRVSVRPRLTPKSAPCVARWRHATLVAAVVGVLAAVTSCSEAVTPASANDTGGADEPRAVSALGRLEPHHGCWRARKKSNPSWRLRSEMPKRPKVWRPPPVCAQASHCARPIG